MSAPTESRLENIPTDDVLAPRKRREMLAVSFGQWDRIQERVRRLGNPRLDHTNYAVGAWGIAIPSFLGFLGYLSQTHRPAWALPTYAAVALASAVAALLISHFQEDEEQVRQDDASDIVAEMKSIADAYLRGDS